MPDKTLEKRSSAFTLSDMEIFVYPDLLYALVLANIMSPVIWEWRRDPWFRDIEKKPPAQRINRLKQFVMDHFVFNLDLDTWGLTTKQKELARFAGVIDEKILAASNALFGYEGDKYYFSIDIRKHFGLDRYEGNVIPYWKTETVEAMQAFQHKPGYGTGAGECVSLSALYTAALYIVARIPLNEIFLIATPLHSQNFINFGDGVLTNNRRIVTKNMWFNGTTLSTKARRALENEGVTIVSHLSGHIHTMYEKATISPERYDAFKKALQGFLRADFRHDIISNFLRKERDFQCCFQYRHDIHDKPMYIEVERIYGYEHTSSKNFSTNSRNALLNEIDTEEFSFRSIPNRIILNDFEEFIRNNPGSSVEELGSIMFERFMIEKCPRIEEMFESLNAFLEVHPRLPGVDKSFSGGASLELPNDLEREEIVKYVYEKAPDNEVCELAQYAYRDMSHIDWEPFVKAAIERNPVSVTGLENTSAEEAEAFIRRLSDSSIYDGKRLALPDEVYNYGRGDGVEKAFLLANVLKQRDVSGRIVIEIDGKGATVTTPHKTSRFSSKKGLEGHIVL